jgi:DNA-binding CsgD family transcriptional regulator
MLNLLTDLPRFISYLNFKPSTDELGKKLLLDFLSPLSLESINFLTLSSSGMLKPISSLGNSDMQVVSDLAKLSSEFSVQNISAELAQNHLVVSADRKIVCSSITNQREEVGLILLTFTKAVNSEDVAIIKVFMLLVSYYLFPKLQIPTSNLSTLIVNPLTPRQRQVVEGFIEGKTNHELSLELGFSISTIRHETMAIFKTLGASDRKEAAKIAQEQSLL